MSMFGPNVPQVPIITGRTRYGCAKGHVDELPGPVIVPLPDEHGRPTGHPVCRLCLQELLASIAVEPVPPAETEGSLEEVFRGR
jgi:hypothetical protein